MTSMPTPTTRPQALTALFLAVAMAATVGSALGFQHLGGYIPCKLCYEQRIPYYVGVPLMLLALVAATVRLPPVVSRGLLFAGGLLMAYGLYLGVYHSGVEWGFWPGPTDCGMVVAPPDTGGKGVLDALNTIVPPSCDKAALRILGLSLAGWNAIASLALAIVAFRGAFAKAG
ncbi:disulfide bond formation protein B [Mesorhizobium sp. LHD-90]|uniref:disulfide bond formation protein B n=1 Tax=Mesorhizobium sp. LHD-90 TaxID=3071414 RepID=UPI0027DEBC35|nr:disulfide bond formation protein B [Mesorhizobium sp. LHD-90]MDQ6432693.1 disulfide bond formation protein B [Mesorhizobium sp. LHD-90]